MSDIVIRTLSAADRSERGRFVDIGRQFSRAVAHYVPQLRSEQMELLDPRRNPFFDHAEVQLFAAYRDDKPVGRISAHIDRLALAMPAEQGMGPGTGNFGYFDAADAEVAQRLLARAEEWLRGAGMTRALGPISLSVWEEPGLLTAGHDHAPTMMMGHHPAHYRGWIEAADYHAAKTLLTYELDITVPFPPLIQRIITSGERNSRITIREAGVDDYAGDVRIILAILNDAWSDNWGFIPFTDREIDYAARKLKPVINPELVRIAELEGKPVAFMLTLPDMNEVLSRIDGRLLPLGWLHVMRWLRNPKARTMRVPLMGVLKEHQNSRLASQLAFMMIEYIRRDAVAKFGATRGEIGWILDDNQGMVAIADALNTKVNREYRIYQKAL
ncbi:GNAT family N-acetyltransferase [Altererythrobacter sp. SALINAS58]|uniref:GNAT family N-acetyltransferase n=1 Tax=Alteripontixanthobacter muriae TaxID=2705546 RepID=UPI0015771DC0|nr:GNAT family N-acetyltransferase [Alteripontixanthobacter muriae]NTZ42903.1 GNAT family N-acetyltransferase [Alteripontixanthobacter muriae]